MLATPATWMIMLGDVCGAWDGNVLVEALISLYKVELIYHVGHLWRDLAKVETVIVEYQEWFNLRRLNS